MKYLDLLLDRCDELGKRVKGANKIKGADKRIALLMFDELAYFFANFILRDL